MTLASSAQKPKAMGVDILLSEPENEIDDRDLAEAFNAAGNLVLATKIRAASEGPLWADPLPIFARNAAAIGHVQAELGPDSICRRVPAALMTAEGPRWAFALEVARVAQRTMIEEDATGLRLGGTQIPLDGPRSRRSSATLNVSPRFLRIDFRGQTLPGESAAPFDAVSAADLLDGKRGEQLRGRAVLIGFGAADLSDRIPTPVTDRLPMPGVEIHANLLSGLLDGRSSQVLMVGVQILLVLSASLISTLLVLHWPGAKGLLALLGSVLGGYAAGFELFTHAHWLVEFGPLLCAGVLAAPLAQLENLIMVDRGLTRSLRQLRRALMTTDSDPGASLRAALRPQAPAPNEGLHWKVELINQLQAELGSLYAFDQTLLETMQEGIAVFAGEGRQLFQNLHWKTFGERLDLRIDADLDELAIALGDPLWRDLSKHLSGPGTHLESELHANGTLWKISAVRLPATSHAGEGAVMVVAYDLTARLERDRARAEALGFVTHELRTPLVSIQGLAEFLLRYPQKAGSSEAAQTIFRESQRMVAMINTYLDLLRLDASSQPVRRQDVNIRTTVTQAERVMHPLAESAGITMKTAIDMNLPPLQGDPHLIAGALLNLLSNAVKYSPRGSEVRLLVAGQEGAVMFEVWNPGPPIPAQELESLFQPFYRRPEHDRKAPGWGLGLAFVKRIAEGHGGWVEVQSDAHSGTRFRILLPSATPAMAACEVSP